MLHDQTVAAMDKLVQVVGRGRKERNFVPAGVHRASDPSTIGCCKYQSDSMATIEKPKML